MEVKPSAPRPFDEVREEARRGLMDQRKRERAQELVKRLRGTAVIEEVEAPVGHEDGVVPAST
jgi:hypothetical protein